MTLFYQLLITFGNIPRLFLSPISATFESLLEYLLYCPSYFGIQRLEN